MVTTMPEDTPYHAIMLDDRLDTYLSGHNNALAAPSNFSQLLFNRLVANEVETAMAQEMAERYENTHGQTAVSELFDQWEAEAKAEGRAFDRAMFETLEKLRTAMTGAADQPGIAAINRDIVQNLAREDALSLNLSLNT